MDNGTVKKPLLDLVVDGSKVVGCTFVDGTDKVASGDGGSTHSVFLKAKERASENGGVDVRMRNPGGRFLCGGSMGADGKIVCKGGRSKVTESCGRTVDLERDYVFESSSDSVEKFLTILNFDRDLAITFRKKFNEDGELLLEKVDKGTCEEMLDDAYDRQSGSEVAYLIVVDQDDVPVCFETGTVTAEGDLVANHSEEEEKFNSPSDGETLKDGVKKVTESSTVINTFDHTRCRGRFNRSFKADDVTIDGRKYSDIVDEMGGADLDHMRVYGRLFAKATVVDGSPLKWIPEADGSNEVSVRMPFVEAMAGKTMRFEKFGISVKVLGDGKFEYADLGKNESTVWGDGVPKVVKNGLLESIGKNDSSMDWFLSIRSVRDSDAVLHMDDPESGRHREYEDESALRKAKSLVKNGIVVPAEIRKERHSAPSFEGFLVFDDGKWYIEEDNRNRTSKEIGI